MNQYDTCQLIQKWFFVCWVIIVVQLQANKCTIKLLLHVLINNKIYKFRLILNVNACLETSLRLSPKAVKY